MTFDPSKPVQTRDGRPARILCTDLNSAEYPIAAVITEDDGGERVDGYMRNGKYMVDGCTNDPDDLINIPKKRAVYVNVYESRRGVVSYSGHLSRWGADDTYAAANPDIHRLACVHVEYEEGQFDD